MSIRIKEGDLVLVVWLDSETPERVWHTVTEAKAEELATCLSVGWFIKQDDAVLVIAMTREEDEDGKDDDEKLRAHVFTIPSSCVKSIRKLRR